MKNGNVKGLGMAKETVKKKNKVGFTLPDF